MVQITTSRKRSWSVGLCLFHLLRASAIALGVIGLLITATIGNSLDRSNTGEEHQTSGEEQQQQPSIPHIMYFTYKTNILQTKEPRLFYDNVMNTTEMYLNAWNDRDARVEFLDDDACRREISTAEPKLLYYFNKEEDGRYKGDICRVAALFNNGGYYYDVDLKALKPVLMEPDVQFSSVREDVENEKKKDLSNFFQAFLASAPRHAVMRETLRIMLAYYEGKHELHGYMGVSTTADGFEAASSNPEEMGKVRLLHELLNKPEVRGYYSDIPKQQGVGCCCQHIVHDQMTREVFFRSRIVGASRFCFTEEQYKEWKMNKLKQMAMEKIAKGLQKDGKELSPGKTYQIADGAVKEV